MKTKWNLLVVFALLASLVGGTAGTVQAAAGDLDPGFAPTGGKLLRDLGTTSGDMIPASVAALQSDGKIVVISPVLSSGSTGIRRYNADGTPDGSFQNTEIPLGSAQGPVAVTVQTGDKVLAVIPYPGSARPEIALVRYNADGTLDTGFGGDGIVNTESISLPTIGYDAYRFSETDAVGVLPDGHIILAGMIYAVDRNYQGILLSYDSSGNLDPGFDGDGVLIDALDGADIEFIDMEVQADGSFLVAVNTWGAGLGRSNSVRRYSAAGAVLQTYGPTSANVMFTAVHGMPQGDVYAAGFTWIAQESTDAMLMHFTADGALDADFGTAGMASAHVGRTWDHERCPSLVVQGNSITVACNGAEQLGTTVEGRFTLWRVGSTGETDTSFGTNGILKTAFENVEPLMTDATARQLFLTPTGKLLAAGIAWYRAIPGQIGLHSFSALVQYDYATGALDAGFVTVGGRLLTDQEYLSDGPVVAVQSSGKIILGSARRVIPGVGEIDTPVLSRYNVDGTLDTSFPAVQVPSPLIPGQSPSYDVGLVAVDSTNRILLGLNGFYGDYVFFAALLRYSAEGVLDTSFGGGDGIATSLDATFPPGYKPWRLAALDFQTDGDIILAGNVFGSTSPQIQGFLLKFLDDGTLDPSFGTNGTVVWSEPETIPPDGSGDFYFGDIDVQADDKILVAANSYVRGPTGQAQSARVLRYTDAGVPDLVSGITGSAAFNAVRWLPGGKVLAVGTNADPDDIYFPWDGLAVRYLPDGTPDDSFGMASAVIADLLGYGTQFQDALVQPDGKILLGGAAGYEWRRDFAVMRLNLDGTPDQTFGVAGASYVITKFDDLATSVEVGAIKSLFLTPGQKILAAGVVRGPAEEFNWAALAQYDPGAIDGHDIGGLVFNDSNKNGVADLGETVTGVNWTINLDQDCNGSIDQTDTADPFYEFTNVPANHCYRISEVPQTGWQQTTKLSDFTLTGDFNLDIGNWYPYIDVMPGDPHTGDVGVVYTEQYYTSTESTGTGPYSFALLENEYGQPSTLPDGLTFTPGGLLSGTPTEGGIFALRVQATDANGAVSGAKDQFLVITLDGSFTLTSSSNPSMAGQSVTFTFTGTGGAIHPDLGLVPPVGFVTFLDGETPIEGCTDLLLNMIPGGAGGTIGDYPATCTPAALAAGTHSIIAVFTEVGVGWYHNAERTLEQTVLSPINADLKVTLTDSKDPVRPGATLVYTLVVKNNGPDLAEGLSAELKLDPYTAYSSVTAPRGWTCTHSADSTNGTVTCTGPALASGKSATIKVTVTVSRTVKVGRSLMATSTLTSATFDPVLTNNTATQKTLVAK